MLSVKQGGIKYHFLSLWYDLTWDWTPVSRTIRELLGQWIGYEVYTVENSFYHEIKNVLTS